MKKFVLGLMIGLTLSLPAMASLKDVDGWNSIYAATFIGWSCGYTRAIEEQIAGAKTDKEVQRIESNCKLTTLEVMDDCRDAANIVSGETRETPVDTHEDILHDLCKDTNSK